VATGGARAAAAAQRGERVSATAAAAPELALDRVGSGPPLVLLHPLGADRRVWAPVIGLLAGERELIAVDLPGFGGSPPLRGTEPSPARLAHAVAHGLAAAGVEDFAVAGNSLGGWVALELALAGRARSVVAIGPAGLWPEPLPPRRASARAAARLAAPFAGALARVPALRRAAMAMFVAHPERMPATAARDLIRAYAHAPGFPAVNAAMRASTFTRLAEIRVPVTLAWPEHDRVVARLRDPPPNVRSVTLPGTGHLPMWDDPRQVAALLVSSSA
jgi:pimeloyl-ACP methyl ester carboxylesterase